MFMASPHIADVNRCRLPRAYPTRSRSFTTWSIASYLACTPSRAIIPFVLLFKIASIPSDEKRAAEDSLEKPECETRVPGEFPQELQ